MGSKINITNYREVQSWFKRLRVEDPKVRSEIRTSMRMSFKPFKTDSAANLRAQGSVSKQENLLRSLAVKTRFRKRSGYFSVAFGANTSGNRLKATEKQKKSRSNKGAHFHLVNSGTKKRYRNNFATTGAVGKRRSDYKGHNPAFKIGFADKAIKSNINRIPIIVSKDLAAIYKGIK